MTLNFAVLMRINALTRSYEQEFSKYGIPCKVYGGFKFFERKEIKDIISYLRVIANHDDDINLLRIINTPRRGIGRKTIEQINEIRFFDLIYQRYANPFPLMDGMLRTHRLTEFVNQFVETYNEEQKDKALWDIWLHRVFDKSYNEFVAGLEGRSKAAPPGFFPLPPGSGGSGQGRILPHRDPPLQ